MNLLPNYERAVIPIEKLTERSLNPKKDEDKAEAFRLALGFTLEHAELLRRLIRENLPLCEAVSRGDLGYGMRYAVHMELPGLNGKTARVLTAWIDDKKENEMRLTSVYVDRR
ncbi:MAG: hypothetical protein LBM98_02820 [Oscillospiraceae bacterium]|jgi:hypothetical protein|nr:hypothetical protein [Oscillospiraceae bacterium]